jgi:ABC-type glycerol-3-phosphate transport system substrate-binding protein
MWTQRKAVPPPADVNQMGGWSSVFMAGIAAISQIYSAFHDTVYKSSKGKFEWRIGRIPDGPAGRFMAAGGAGWSIPSSARVPDVAWDWARTQVSHLPTVKAVAAAGYTVAHFETMATAAAPTGELKEKLGGTWKQAMIDDLKTFGKPTYYSYIGTEYPQMVAAEMDSLVNGTKTPKPVADAIVAKATRMLEDNR